MKQEIKDRWVARLRDPLQKQAKGALRRGDARCCLGVLCEIAVEDGIIQTKPTRDSWTGLELEPDDEDTTWFYGDNLSEHDYLLSDATLPQQVKEWAGMTSTSGEWVSDNDAFDTDFDHITHVSLIELNDDREYDFPAIADAIEENWEKL